MYGLDEQVFSYYTRLHHPQHLGSCHAPPVATKQCVDSGCWPPCVLCDCLTQAYGYFAKGTGSLLSTLLDPQLADDRWRLVDGNGSLVLTGYTANRTAQSASSQNEAAPVNDDELAAAWKKLRLRYFTVGEIAQLHSYPSGFQLPPGMSNRKGYQLLGNSLSVAVVADVLGYVLNCA